MDRHGISHTTPRWRTRVIATVPAVAATLALFAGPKTAQGDSIDDVARTRNERCAIRLSAAIVGQSPSAELLASSDPRNAVDAMLERPEFIERFARFFNARSNRQPAMAETPGADAVYFLTKHVLEHGKPWSDLFVGPYVVAEDGAVSNDPNGLGYFRSPVWIASHAGNDPSGLRLSSAYRILQNTVGLKVEAVTGAPNATLEERSALGRKRAECASCHYDSWYALDKVAAVLTRRKGGGGKPVTFEDPPEGYAPQDIVDGTVRSDKELLDRLVASENFSFNACRIAFTYLNGREENSCEGVLFDKCVVAFKAQKTMTSAIAAFAKDPGYCQ